MPNSKGKTLSVPLVGNHTLQKPPLQNYKVNFITITDHGCGFLIKPPVAEVLWGQSSGFIFLAIANKKTITYHQIQKAQKPWLPIANTTKKACSHSSEHQKSKMGCKGEHQKQAVPNFFFKARRYVVCSSAEVAQMAGETAGALRQLFQNSA